MGDIWPWGPPQYVTFRACRRALVALGMSEDDGAIGAAVATAESSRDLKVLNDTAATGDYSVGCWQINYFGSLRPGRVAAYGTPAQLARGGLAKQAAACYGVWSGSGWSAWSTYTSGAYKQYLSGGGGTSSGGGPPGPAQPTISEGATGAAVTTLQLDLDDLGAKLTADGVFGPATLAAVKSFQSSHGLTVDGVVGPATWAGIYQAMQASNPSLPNPGPPPAPAPPSEPAGNIDPGVVGSWANLQTATGQDAAATFRKLSGYQDMIRGAAR